MGIKSYQGKFEKQPKAMPEQISVRDYMSTDIVAFNPGHSVMQVISDLVKYRISGGPVVNDRYELVGMISEGDCVKQIADSQYYNMPVDSVIIADCMVKEVETIAADLSIFEAARQFLTSKRRRFPIVEKGKLIGQISQKDILKAAVKLHASTWDRKNKKDLS